MKPKQILLATDFSPISDLALEVASRLAHESGAKLIVLHVEPGQPTAWMGPAYYDIADPNISEIARTLVAVKPLFSDVAVEHCIGAGDPAAEIVRFAAEKGVDWVIVGSHSGRGIRQLLLGSVAQAVLRRAPCPVLVCHNVVA